MFSEPFRDPVDVRTRLATDRVDRSPATKVRHSKPNQRVHLCRRKWLGNHLLRTSSRLT
jgi:hypothetical protein